MNNEIYFDNSATTALCNEAKVAMTNVIENFYGNPSSLHTIGLAAEKQVSAARSDILASIGVRGDARQLIFCSSGSEANNLATIGVYTSKKRREGTRIITTAGEHSSIEAAMAHLESLGASVVRLSTKNGKIDFEELTSALSADTALISIMLVNNETGARYPVEEIFKIAKRICPDIICHCDAVQGYGKIKFTPKSLGADLVTVSAHKIHGPKGVAALYVSPEVLKRRALVPIIHGGQQENGLRAGTENTVGIAGFGAAAKAAVNDFANGNLQVDDVSRYIIERISTDEHLKEIRINRPEVAIPNIINITLPSIKSETMLHFLSGKGIFVSSGSACSSHAKSVSRALSSFGISDKEADCSIRISISKFNTTEEAKILCDALADGISSLIRIKK
ncbi:MAG: cysteine desulfurase [Ruminococcaceae bacterium]|nr:cysteine desulfurase [Oscillospiraceae bacterium]